MMKKMVMTKRISLREMLNSSSSRNVARPDPKIQQFVFLLNFYPSCMLTLLLSVPFAYKLMHHLKPFAKMDFEW